MTRYVFEEVTAFGRKAGKCAVCGKRATRSREFTNTINPWNRNDDGIPRTRAEIRAIVNQQARDWEAGPLTHVKCES